MGLLFLVLRNSNRMPSSVISAFDFNPDQHILKIKFVSGMNYSYFNVPVSVYKSLKRAKSKGSYFNRHIRNNYSFKKQG
ncbi:KTSC domain-containing protein [Olivibacter ginsenosidimutans]|uniref:KTSC domain-containing protein n=1 Tax=Olivibacter ginsenosidimutans TaxID=1176537 RepID=A0ABP9BC24_9SPHI